MEENQKSIKKCFGCDFYLFGVDNYEFQISVRFMWLSARLLKILISNELFKASRLMHESGERKLWEMEKCST